MCFSPIACVHFCTASTLLWQQQHKQRTCAKGVANAICAEVLTLPLKFTRVEGLQLGGVQVPLLEIPVNSSAQS
jgi:hypothetical protein